MTSTPTTKSETEPGHATRLELDRVSTGLLEDVNLNIAPGEIVCLSGPSGSGKSRLLRAIADLDPHTGEIRLDGQSRSSLPGHEWRARVMLVPAESHWWADTVGGHFAQAMPDALHALGFEPEAANWPAARLSSGEKQRLALIRAVSRRPRALLLDEPTSNLDAEATRQCENWLKRLVRKRGLPVLWVAHDVEQIRRVADRRFRIRGARVEAA